MSFSTEKGARNFAYAAVADVPSGSYIQMVQPTEPSAFVLSEKGQKCQKQVWEEMKAVWIKQDAGVRHILNQQG